MNTITLNLSAIEATVTALVGEPGAKIITELYSVIAAAEDRGYARGFEVGENSGHQDGFNLGYDMGVMDGFRDGYNAAEQDRVNQSWVDAALVDWPITLNEPVKMTEEEFCAELMGNPVVSDDDFYNMLDAEMQRMGAYVPREDHPITSGQVDRT